jgi:DNA mismatch repair protein MutS2
VHGASSSGATLYLEPLATVEINNDLVALEAEEAEEVQRILLELTDRFRARADDVAVSEEVATSLDVLQAKARLAENHRRHGADLVGGRASRAARGAPPAAHARRRVAVRRRCLGAAGDADTGGHQTGAAGHLRCS